MTEIMEDLCVSFHSLFGLESDQTIDGQLSDVMFIIEGKPLPSNKSVLSDSNNVFKAMFSGNFKESKDNEVVIEGTTFEAFKTLCLFLYYNQLVLKDDNDLDLIEEVYKLTDRYQTPELMDKIKEHLIEIPITLENMASISRIAFNYQMEGLIERVMTFFDNNIDHFVDRVINELKDTALNKLFKVLAHIYRKISTESTEIKEQLDRMDGALCQCGSLNFIKAINPNNLYCCNCKALLYRAINQGQAEVLGSRPTNLRPVRR